jgi:hypothetical protein
MGYYRFFLEGRAMKKRIFSSIVTLGACLGIILGVISTNSLPSYAAAEPQGEITIDDEYLIPDSMDWCTYYVVVATNNTGSDISISADFVAKDKKGTVLRKVNDYSDAVKAGQQFILYGQFLNSATKGAASYEYAYTINPTDRCAYSSVTFDAARSDDGIQVKATNGSKFDVQGVGVRTVFMKDGKAVAFDTVNIADTGWTFRSGSTNSQVIGMNAGDYDKYIMTYTSVANQAVVGDL